MFRVRNYLSGVMCKLVLKSGKSPETVKKSYKYLRVLLSLLLNCNIYAFIQ